MAEIQVLLQERAADQCELCGQPEKLDSFEVSGGTPNTLEGLALVCPRCRAQLETESPQDRSHLNCLQGSIWSEVPAVQVLSWRLLKRMPEEQWAIDLLEQVYLEESVLAWAEAEERDIEEKVVVLDSNGAVLAEGDSVTLIKDLPVKGANFTAKRGTLVKNIRIGDDPTHVEGRVNKMSIMLKTCFLKRVVS